MWRQVNFSDLEQVEEQLAPAIEKQLAEIRATGRIVERIPEVLLVDSDGIYRIEVKMKFSPRHKAVHRFVPLMP